MTRLDLGCGKNKQKDFIGVDSIAFPGVDVVLNLVAQNPHEVLGEPVGGICRVSHVMKYMPWPWETDSVDEVHSSHFVEHLTAYERVHFWNELFRVLKPGAKATIITPHWSSCRAYGDPTHQWPPMSEFAWFYLKKDWRDVNAPHTDIANNPNGFTCNFDATGGYTIEPGTQLRNQEAQVFAITYYKEACQDMVGTLVKVPIPVVELPKPK